MELREFQKAGEGANGVVFRCKDELNRDLAVKFFTNSLEPISERVLGHAESLKKINHPNVVRIIGVERLTRPESQGKSTDELALVMEYVPGISYGDWLATTNKDHVAFQEFAEGLLAGLGAFHAAGTAHGDLHSQNIRVAGGKVKLIDPMARNPCFIYTTSSTEDSLRRDVWCAHQMLYEAMRSFNFATASLASFFDPSRNIQSLNDLRARYLAAVEINLDIQGETMVMPQNVSFYTKCRTAQSQKNQVEWQELGKEANRMLPAAFESLRGELGTSINSKSEAQKSLTQAMNRIEDVLAFVCAGVESSEDDGVDAVSMLGKVLTIDWEQGGNTAYVHLPEGVFYGVFHIAGAVAASCRRTRVVEQLTAMRHFNRYDGKISSVLKSRDVIGWPQTIRDCVEAWDWLNGLYSKMSVLRSVFPTENDYKDAVHAFNMLCCISEVRMDTFEQCKERLNSSNRNSRYAVPPNWLRATNERLLGIWQIVSHQKFKAAWGTGVRQDMSQVRALWPELVGSWIDVNLRYEKGFYFDDIDWIKSDFPFAG